LLCEVDLIADHPEVELFETCLPASLELSKPTTVLGSVGDVDDDPDEIIAMQDLAVSPVPFDLLGLVARGPEAIHDLQDRLGQPLAGHFPAVIESEWEQDLEPPPVAAHRSPCPGR
jgi:hypothetical protein